MPETNLFTTLIYIFYNLNGKFSSHLSFLKKKGCLDSLVCPVHVPENKKELMCRCGPAEHSCEFKQDSKRNQRSHNHRSLPCLILGKQWSLSLNVFLERGSIPLCLTVWTCSTARKVCETYEELKMSRTNQPVIIMAGKYMHVFD